MANNTPEYNPASNVLTYREDIDIGNSVKRQVVTLAPRGGQQWDAIGALNEPMPNDDNGLSGLNGRLQRVCWRLANMIALFPNLNQAWDATNQALKVINLGTKPALLARAGPSQWNYPVVSNSLLSVPGGTLLAQLSVEGGDIRYTDDGVTNCTAAIGFRVANGTSWTVNGGIASSMRMTAINGTPVVNVSYYK